MGKRHSGPLARFLAIVTVALLLLAACAPAATPTPAPAKPAESKPTALPAAAPAAAAVTSAQLLEAAKKEGKVVWYTSGTTAFVEPLAAGFTKKTGIEVEMMRTGSERVYQRIAQEHDAGIKAADVVETGDISHFMEWKEKGLLLNYLVDGADKYGPDYRDKDGAWYSIFADIMGMAYNPNLVKGADIPKKYTDALDPKWKGKIAHSHPGYSGQVLSGMMVVLKLHGWEYYSKLAKNEPLVVQSIVDSVAPVVSGERLIAALMNTSQYVQAQKKGSPFITIYPEEGAALAPEIVAALKDAPHPNAAKLFLDYALSPEGQQAAWDFGYTSTRSDMPAPAGRKALKDIKIVPIDPQDLLKQREAIKDKFRELFGV